MSDWSNAQNWERAWHDNCINSFHEESKQLVYAEKMGLVRTPTLKTPYNFDLGGESVLDIGGGAYSLLLKCVNFKDSHSTVLDPLMSSYPQWVLARYEELGVFAHTCKGEEAREFLPELIFDEVWIYNVLEHCEDPEKVIQNAKKMGKIIRIFEWVNTRLNDGHIHSLKESELNTWLGGSGKVETIKRGGAVGECYYGIFLGDHYA